MKKFSLSIITIFLFFITINTQGQINYTANDQITPYNGVFRPGVNPGYYGQNWNDFLLTDIAGGNPAAGTDGAGVRAFRSSLPEFIALIYDYPTWRGIYDYYDLMGMKDNTMIIGFAHPSHADPVQYCDGIPTDMFANLYEPIFDGGLNGTPVNENNYFARYIWDLLEEVGDHVKFWEVWNEPGFDYTGATGWLPPGQPGNWWENNPDPCDYKLRAPIFHFVRSLRVAYEVIKTHSPDDYVVFSGSGFESFLDAVLRNTDNPVDGSVTAEYPLGGGAYFDVIGGHFYPHFDGTMRQWNNNIGGFEYFRHSDRGADGLITKRTIRDGTLAGYGYDGNTYPKKIWTLTEYNVPNAPFPDFNNSSEMFFGSIEGARNFIMKSFVIAMKEDFVQIHPYQLGERQTAANSTGSFDRMGFFDNLNVLEPFDQNILEQGIGYKTTTDLLFEKTYDAARTAEMNIPSTMNGGAFRNAQGQYTYVLWAKTTIDQSEFASANYTFPSSMNVGNVQRRNWDYGTTGNVSTQSSQGISLDASPAFFTPTSNSAQGEITMNCPIDSINIELVATLQEGGRTFSWTTPTATTSCPLGGLTITQTNGQSSETFFMIGGDLIIYEATDACGNVVECGFRINVRQSSGGVGNSTTGCHASRENFNFLGNFGGHKYFISDDPMTYTEGLALAAGHGGYIVSINSPEENTYIRNSINAQAFIGLNDVAQEGNVVWDDGSPVTYTNYDDCVWCENNTSANDAVEYHPWNGKWSWILPTDERKVILEVPCAETLGCGCDNINEPVCGSNGVNYPNACEAECAGIFVYSYGSCSGGSNCSTGPTSIVPCDDADPCTVNDVQTILDADGTICVPCMGTPENCATGITTIVTCNDNNPNTINDVETILSCSGTVCVPCMGTPINGGCNAPNSLSGFTSLGQFGNSKYYLSNDISKPVEAQSVAAANGGYLAVVSSQGENDFIQQNISEMIYIGLNDVASEGNLQWVNGEALTYNNIDVCAFCNENTADLDYVIMAPWNGTWSFSSQWNSRKYIVEIPCGGSGSSDITLTCPPNIDFTLQNGASSVAINYLDAFATTTCPDGGLSVNRTSGPASGASLSVGTYTVTYEATDACGNSKSCSFTITITAGNNGGDCPDDIAGFTAIGEFGTSKYYLSNGDSRPTDAQAEAATHGGYVVTINSQGENDFIQQNISEMTYIGLNDANSENTLEWFNGESVSYNNVNVCSFCNENSADMDFVIMAPWNGDWSFSNFYNSRPYVMEIPCDGSTGGGSITKNCPSNQSITIAAGETQATINYNQVTASTTCADGGLMITKTSGPGIGESRGAGTYNVVYTITDACGNSEQCSFVITVVAGNGGGCPNTLTGYQFIGEFGNSAYFITNDISRPVDAQTAAAANGGHLAVINSQAENDFIWNEIDELVYIGIDDYQTENTLAWVDGSAVNYTNFDVCNFCNENTPEMDFVVMHSWNGAWSWSNFYNQRKAVIEVPCTQTIANPNIGNTLIGTTSQVPLDAKLVLEGVFPNPAMEYVYTKINSTHAEEIEIQMYDARGMLVKSQNVNLYRGLNSTEIDIADLPAGFYSIYIPEAQVQFGTMRFVKVGE